MTTLQNKTTDIDGVFEDGSRKATYADLIRIPMMNLTPSNTIAQQRKDFRIIDVLEDAIKNKLETLSFEDSDFIYMKEVVKNANWQFKNKGLFELEDDINAAIDK